MKWGIGGHWEVLRTPETDTEGTIDIAKLAGEEEDFMGEKLQTRDQMKDLNLMEELQERGAFDQYKANITVQKEQEKRLALKKKAMEELDAELHDPNSLASYAQLHWKRLTQKSQIAEIREKLEEAQKALAGTIKELNIRRRKYPHYENEWQGKIRRIQEQMNPKHAKDNSIDKPREWLRGHRVLRLVGKGNKPATMPITVPVLRVLEACRGRSIQTLTSTLFISPPHSSTGFRWLRRLIVARGPLRDIPRSSDVPRRRCSPPSPGSGQARSEGVQG